MDSISTNFQNINLSTLLLLLTSIITTLLVSGAIANFVKNILSRWVTKQVSRVISKIVLYLFYFIGFSYSLTKVANFNLPAMLAALGVLGAFVFVPTIPVLQNAIAGIVITFLRPISEGQYVDISGELCMVDDISLLKTRMISMNGRFIFIPNINLINGNIINYSKGKYERIEETIEIKQPEKLTEIEEIIKTICYKNERILNADKTKYKAGLKQYFEENDAIDDVSPGCFVKKITSDKLVISVYFWIDEFPAKTEIISEFYQELKIELNNANILLV